MVILSSNGGLGSRAWRSADALTPGKLVNMLTVVIHMLTDFSTDRPPPMLGVLLRTPWQSIRIWIHRDLVAAGFSDVRPRDLAVLERPGPDGMRQIDIAANADMSKQAVKPLIDHLERCGYLERVPDPDDHRAQRIHTTRRGKQLIRTAAAIITAIDQEIEDKLGAETNARLRTILEELGAITAGPRDHR